MNRLLSVGLGFCLLFGVFGKAMALQGLVIVVVVAMSPNGPVIGGFEPSAALTNDLCGKGDSGDSEVCDLVLDKHLVGNSAAAALARVFGAGFTQFIFEPANTTAGKPLLIVAEDVEGEVLAVPVAPAHRSLHLITMAGESGATLITCDFSTAGHEVVHLQQQQRRGSASVVDVSEEMVRCVDAVQEGLFEDLTLMSATPFVTTYPHRAHGPSHRGSSKHLPWANFRSVGVGFYLLTREEL